METCIGKVTHFYSNLGVAILSLSGELNMNDIIHLIGHTTDFVQRVCSMEVNHHKITIAHPGAEIALKVEEPVRRGDPVFLVQDEDAPPATC